MWRHPELLKPAAGTVLLLGAVLTGSVAASDACRQAAIHTRAEVTVSDGGTFRVETWYADPGHAAVRHHQETVQTIAVEGPLGWARAGDKSQLGGDAWKGFALGHQYHALMLDFEKVVPGELARQAVTFDGERQGAIGGAYPYGGEVFLVGEHERPAGILINLPETPPIEARFGDWRMHQGRALPFRVEIDDGRATFEYRYQHVDLGESTTTWFFDTVLAPEIDEVEIYRLHRLLLAAHCDGDAAAMAALSTPEVLVSGRGELTSTTREALRMRFHQLFETVDYTRYVDLVEPSISVSDSADIGWVAVQVRTGGVARASGEAFDHQWSWIMLARKLEGAWRHAGNASNRLPRN